MHKVLILQPRIRTRVLVVESPKFYPGAIALCIVVLCMLHNGTYYVGNTYHRPGRGIHIDRLSCSQTRNAEDTLLFLMLRVYSDRI